MRASRTDNERLDEIIEDLNTTRRLYRRTKSKQERAAINKLRWLLIREKHKLSYNNDYDF